MIPTCLVPSRAEIAPETMPVYCSHDPSMDDCGGEAPNLPTVATSIPRVNFSFLKVLIYFCKYAEISFAKFSLQNLDFFFTQLCLVLDCDFKGYT